MLILWAGTVASVALGQVDPLGSEFIVNTFTNGEQVKPEIATGNDGSFFVVWSSRLLDNNGTAIAGRRFDPLGSPRGDDFQINTYTEGSQDRPSVAINQDGLVFVVWHGPAVIDQSRISGQLYDSTGMAVGPEFQVNTNNEISQLAPAVEALPDGSFWVVWHGPRIVTPGSKIMGRRFDSSGSPMGSSFDVSDASEGNQTLPALAAGADGRLLIAWQQSFPGLTLDEIRARLWDTSGSPIGGDFTVNSTTFQSQIQASVAATAIGEYLVVWRSIEQDEGDASVHGQLLDSSVLPLGGEFQINIEETSGQRYPSIASIGPDSFIVTWTSLGQDGDNDAVVGRVIRSVGPEPQEFLVNSFTTAIQRLSAVAAQPNGEFVVVWESDGADGNNEGIAGRRFRESGIFFDGFETGDTSRWSSVVPSL